MRADLAVVRKDRASLEEGLASLLAAAGDYETELDTLRRFRNEEFLRIGVHDIQGCSTRVRSRSSCRCSRTCASAARSTWRARRSPSGTACRPAASRSSAWASSAAGAQLQLRSRPHLRLRRDARRRLGDQRFTSSSRRSRSGSWSCSSHRRGRDRLPDRHAAAALREAGAAGVVARGVSRVPSHGSALWERQALISARGAAGDGSLIAEVESVTEGFVYGRGSGRRGRRRDRPDARAHRARAGSRERRPLEHQDRPRRARRRRVRDPDAAAAPRCTAIPRARCRRTEDALDALRDEGLLDGEQQRALLSGYRFLRALESRLRIERDQPVEALDPGDAKLAALARRLGYEGSGRRGAAAQRFGEHARTDPRRLRPSLRRGRRRRRRSRGLTR